ncbi:MAG: hypothetical protein ACYDAC_02230 [Candidatus Dormibacteria bacterium]
MTPLVDLELAIATAPSATVAPVAMPVGDRLRLARRRRRLAGARDLFGSVAMVLTALTAVTIVLFSLIGR